jgi:4-amino-4-deoxy-L-arabinose transferase-like glycosyltransferase
MGNGKIISTGLVLAAIIGLAGYLRFYRLSFAPPSVNWDEASYGYNAYSLWKTGKDEYGAALPLSIRSFDDYKPPVYAYLTAPIVGILGLNEFNTRFVSALFGTLGVMVAFALVTKMSGKSYLGLLTALALATAPELVHFSRLAFEAVPALTFFLISLYYLLKAKEKKKFYFWAFLFATLAFFCYNSHKIYWFLEVVWIAWQLKGEIRKQIQLIGALVILCLPVLYAVVFTNSLARFSSTSILPVLVETKSFYRAGEEVINRYVANLSPANIFVRGTNEPNLKVYDFSVFFPFECIFFLSGLGVIFRNWRKERFFLFWFLTAPIPAVLTWSWFSPIRVLPLWWATAFVIAKGVEFWWMRLKSKLIKIAVTAGVAVWWMTSVIWLYMTIIWYMPYTQYGLWQWGFRETIRVIAPIMNKYQRVVWESPHAQPYIFVLFYSKYDPAKYQAELPEDYKLPKARTKWDFDKFEFRKIYWPSDRATDSSTLFVGGVYSLPQQDIQGKWRIIEDVIDPVGYVNFRVVGKEPK